MPLDAALVAETRSWLVKAEKDLRAAQHGLGASPALLEDAAFHCQQAIEKTLKAFLTWHGRPFRKTHNLIELARIFHESLAATTDLAVLPGVHGCWSLRRTVQVRLGTNPLRLPGGTPIFAVSRHQFMKHPG
jgi:hypothetical protein